jgi:hypothetical protein
MARPRSKQDRAERSAGLAALADALSDAPRSELEDLLHERYFDRLPPERTRNLAPLRGSEIDAAISEEMHAQHRDADAMDPRSAPIRQVPGVSVTSAAEDRASQIDRSP